MANVRSQVEDQQIDLSQVVRDNAQTVLAAVVRSRRGKLEPVLVGDTSMAIQTHGKPDLSLGMTMSGLLIAMRQAQSTYIRRVAGAGYMYAGIVVAVNEDTSLTELFPVTAGANPEDFDFAQWKLDTDEIEGTTWAPLFLLYAVGPGEYANTEIAVQIRSSNILPPDNLSATKVAGGVLVAGAYTYSVCSRNVNGRTDVGTPVTVTLSAPDVSSGLNSIRLTWDPVPGAAGYEIFGRVGGSEERIASVNGNKSEFTDTGSIVPDGDLPIPDEYVDSPEFQIAMYDTTIAANIPQNVVDVTLLDHINGFGINTELEQTINLTSAQFVKVVNNTAAYYMGDEPPALTTTPKTFLDGGEDGIAPTDFDAALAWKDYENRDAIRVNLLCDTGWQTPTFTQAMKRAADKQKGHYATSVPSTKQAAVDSIEYRSSMGLNDRRGSLFTPWLKGSDIYNGRVTTYPPAVYAVDRMLFTDRIASAGRSPAGLNRGVTDALDLSDKKYYYNEETDMEYLARSQVNYFRARRGVGIVLWEQLTLQSNFSAASFISVSRIWDVIQNSIVDFLEYELQEPNDDFFAEQIREALSGYLELQVLARNIKRADVYVDERAGNTNDVLSSGQRNVDVYLEPTLPANRIRFRSILTKQGADFETLVV
jgi:hypothetical protein